MRMLGWCTRCRRMRQVQVSGHGLAMAASSGVASGVCAECDMSADDLLRESKRLYGDDLRARRDWLRTHRSINAPEAVRRIHAEIARLLKEASK